MSTLELPREHTHNQRLLDHVRPLDWHNPTPQGRYNFVVIGGGSAGLIAASGAASLGAKVALIEKNFLGGDCLNVGCVPSKALIRAARVVGEIERGRGFGIEVDGVSADFNAVMDHVRKARADIAPHDSAQHYRDLGVDVYFGDAHFTGKESLEIGGTTLQFKRALIATGSRPTAPPISGLAETGYLTSETLWNIVTQPERMAIIGAGSVGLELAQAFQRLGTQVTLFDIEPRILPREEEDVATIVADALQRDGVLLRMGCRIGRISAENNTKRIEFEMDDAAHSIVVDEILVATGRAPNVEGLALERAGVNYDSAAIHVDDHLRTTNPAIYAAGDVAMAHKFTHVAGHAAAIVVQNALFPIVKRKASSLLIPWATYCDPEIAHVGLYPHEAEAQGIAVRTYKQSFAGVDRAITDGETEGMITIHVKKGSDKIVGATVVGSDAGELISQIAMAMKYGIGLGKIMMVVFPYPTQAEILQKVAGHYSRARLTPPLKRIVNWWMARTR